jgi:hypothetical protein
MNRFRPFTKILTIVIPLLVILIAVIWLLLPKTGKSDTNQTKVSNPISTAQSQLSNSSTLPVPLPSLTVSITATNTTPLVSSPNLGTSTTPNSPTPSKTAVTSTTTSVPTSTAPVVITPPAISTSMMTTTTSTKTTTSATTLPSPLIDFTKWTAEPYAAMTDEDYSQPWWDLSTDKKSITESRNCQPSLFYSDFTAMNTSLHLKIKPTTTSEPDDDYFGFALGIQPKDTSNHQANYLLIDWKNSIPEENLYKDFVEPGPGGSAEVGLALSHVTGVPTPDEFWQHADFDLQGSPQGEGLTELVRATSLGNIGWNFDHEYDFNFEFSETGLKVYVDGNLEMTTIGNFNNGKMAFYNFSQAGVSYRVSSANTQ